MNARRLRPARPVEVLDEEAWDVPDCLLDDDWRAFGPDGRRAINIENEEDER